MAAPIPLDAPVTTATFPLSFPGMLRSFSVYRLVPDRRALTSTDADGRRADGSAGRPHAPSLALAPNARAVRSRRVRGDGTRGRHAIPGRDDPGHRLGPGAPGPAQ